MTDRSTAQTAQTDGPWTLLVVIALVALVLITNYVIGTPTIGGGLECETAAQCERLAAEQKAILRTAILYTVVATVALGLAVFGYNLYTGAGPGAASDPDDE